MDTTNSVYDLLNDLRIALAVRDNALARSEYELGVLRQQVAVLREACTARSHAANDFNCPSEPYADECSACKGAAMRRAALAATEPKE